MDNFSISSFPDPIQNVLLLLLSYLTVWVLCVATVSIATCVSFLAYLSATFGAGEIFCATFILTNSLKFLFHIILIPLYAIIGLTFSILYILIATVFTFLLLIWAILWSLYTKFILRLFKKRNLTRIAGVKISLLAQLSIRNIKIFIN